MSHHDHAEELYTGKYMQMLKIGTWEYATRPNTIGAVGIVAITDQHEILLVEQFRIPVNVKTLELPAGLTGDEAQYKGEAKIIAAKRELLEECGYEAAHWEELTTALSSPGMTDEACTLFLATGLTQVSEGGGLDNEDIIVHRIPLDKVETWLKEKEAEGYGLDFKVYAGLYYAKTRL